MSTVVWFVAIEGDRSKKLVIIFGFNKDATEQIIRKPHKQKLLESI